MRRLLCSMGFALAMAIPVSVHADESKLSAVDAVALDRLIDPVLESLRGTSSREALTQHLATAKTGTFGPALVTNLVTQVDTSLELYGRVVRCNLYDEQVRGGIVARREYVCQHEKFVTRWIFTAVKLPEGWSAGSIFFDDKIDQLF